MSGYRRCSTLKKKKKGILVIKRNEITPFAATWTDPEMIIRSEVSKRKTSIILYQLYVEAKI